jgi:tetratricopeptide (TPR) repeat protein
MAEELSASTPEGIDPLATSLAMAGASRDKADAFLEDQRHHMHEQLKEIGLRLWELRLGVLLRTATLIVGLAAATGVGLMVWDAAHSNGLIIEPFNVPPDLAARGMTGEVIAAKVLDELVSLQGQTNSGRPAKSYANSWGEHGIKLEIPETGISLNELDKWLREKLGHDSRLSGEVVRTDDGIMLTARSDSGAVSVSGAEKDLNALTVKLAEQAYRVTQPFRYGMYLLGKNRGAEALPIFETLAKTGDKEDRLWAYNRWVSGISNRDGVDVGIRLYRRGLAMDPDSIGMYDNFAGALSVKGRQEEMLQVYRAQREHLLDGKQTYVPAARIPTFERMAQARIGAMLGAYHEAAQTWSEVKDTGYPGYNTLNLTQPILNNRLGEHDLAAAREALADYAEASGGQFSITALAARMQLAQQAEDWSGVAALADAAVPEISKHPLLVLAGAATPMIAYSNARLGRFDAAQAAIDPTAAECYPCLRARAWIAELRGDHRRADYWFARAIAEGPSLPFAEFEWGQAWLSRGQPDAAIEKFKLSIQKGPHFADPLEGWGEALMAKNQSHLALAKFAEAEKYAPNWGRLHLKWGEALVYAGKPAEATAQFACAATLDLTPSEKSELAGMVHG